MKRKLAKLKRTVRAQNLNRIKSAIIIYDYDVKAPQQDKLIRDFARSLKEESIKVSTLGYIPKKLKAEEKPKEELDYYYFDKTELNWLKIPRSERLEELCQKPFDLLIDLNTEGYFPLKWFSFLSLAAFKVGGSKGYQQESCDLLLETDPNNKAEFQKQTLHYLNMINQTK